MHLLKIPHHGKVAVIGAGISGLTFSYFLSRLRPDINITIFEQKSETGGYIKSQLLTNQQQEGNVLLEKGPRTLRGISDGTLVIIDILKSLNFQDQIEAVEKTSISNKKYLLNSDNNLIQLPNSIKTLVRFLNSGIINGIPITLLKEPFNKSKLDMDKDESVESFFNRRFGNTLLSDKMLSAIIHGIYAGDISKLSVKSVFPSLIKFETENGSIIKAVIKSIFQKKPQERKLPESLLMYQQLISPNSNLINLSEVLKNYPMIKLKDGLQGLPNSLTNYLIKQSNINIVYNSKISQINPTKSIIQTDNNQIMEFDHIRSTINSNGLSHLLTNTSSDLKNSLSLDYVNVFLCNIYSQNSDIIPKDKRGFGFLVPKFNKNHECLLGVIFDSDIEQNSQSLFSNNNRIQKNYSKLTFMLGGHYFDELGAIPSNSVNLKIVKKILSNIFKINLENYNLIIRDEVNETNKTIKLNPQDLLISFDLYKNCIPQFNVGYNDRKDKLKSLIENECKGRFSIGGMAFGNGIGVPDCVVNSLEDALSLK